MSRKLSVVLTGLSVAIVMILSGCGPAADLSLKFSADEAVAYTATTEVIKDFRFEQPNMNKLREEQTKTVIAMGFTQKTLSVDENGDATVQITIDGLMVDMINKNEPKFAYDSSNEKDKNSPMGKLLGQTYTFKMTPAGDVTNVDTAKAKTAVKSGFEKKIADSILDPKNVTERHQLVALPKEDADKLSKGDTWSQTVPSPPGLLAPKTYQKNYTLTGINDNQATVEMVAGESAEQVEGSKSMGGMGMFAKMFDNEDDYTGKMVVDMASGKVVTMEETLISSYIAQEMPENGDPEKGPDTLTMKFTNTIKLEKRD